LVKVARDEKLMIRLEERTKLKFQEWADRYGVTMSALGAVVIGQWIAQQERAMQERDFVLQQAAEAVQRQLSRPLTDKEFEALQRNAPGFVELMREIAKDALERENRA
jgi:GH24 family phage-related lysozyme (muramidase)